MDTILRPATDWELASYLADASRAGTPVEIIGSGTRTGYGQPERARVRVSTQVMRGVTSFDAAAGMITMQGGTRLADIHDELEAAGLMLAFEPLDIAPIYGFEAGWMTAGGMVAANLAGSRGIVCGGVGASVAGARVVSGDGEIITAGGAVGSGRTGLDLTRLVAGSMGTLGVIAEVTLRLAARPLRRATLVVHGLAGEIAVEAMGDVLAGCPGITGAIHLDGAMAAGLRESALAGSGPGGTGDALTLLRLEAACDAGLGQGVKRLTGLLETYGEVGELDDVSSDGVWDEIRRMGFIAPGEAAVWRIMVRPSRAAELVGGIRRYMMADAAYDWGGGVVWLVTPPAADAGASDVRRVTAAMGAVATLVRAGDAVRQSVDCFEPPEEGVAGLARRLKAAFDPAGILNPGRLYRGM